MSQQSISVVERIGHRMYRVEYETGAPDKLAIESLQRSESRGTRVVWTIEKPADYDDSVRLLRQSIR